MNQQKVHQYVIEHITGSLGARQNTKRLLWQTFVLALCVSLAILLSKPSDSSTLGIALATLLAGIPFGVLAQRSTLSLALSRDALRLKRFLIGKKGYIAPKDHVLHQHADLFSIAANLVCQEPFLSPNSQAAAWHTSGTLVDAPGVAVYTGWYGDNQPVIFMYGDPKTITDLSSDIWDLGHVRKLTPGDTERFVQTTAGWTRQHLIPVALAYAPLPANADPAHLNSNDLASGCTLLGALGVEGSRGYGQSIPLSPATSVTRAAGAQAILSVSLVLYAGLSVILDRFLDKPAVVGLVQLGVFSLFIGPLLLAVYSWDQAQKSRYKLPNFGTLFWSGAFIAGLSYGTSLLYEYAQTTTTINSPIIHQSAAAVGLLTFGICLLLQVVLARANLGVKTKTTPYNPLFMLAISSGFLLILIMTYATGPLLLGGMLLAIGASLGFVGVREIHAYANRHHSRDHIFELLKST